MIRPMTMADYDEVIALWQGVEGVGLSDADSREKIDGFLGRNPHMSFVAEASGELVGAVLCGHDGRRGYLHHLAVHRARRGQGIARSLAESCFDRLQGEGISRCHVFVYPDNIQGMNFWMRVGFFKRDDLCLFSRDL